MAEASEGNAQGWKKPGDVMKKIRIRKKNKFPGRSLSTSQPLKSDSGLASRSHSDRNVNPFAKKRLNSDTTQTGKKRILSLSDASVLKKSEVLSESSADRTLHTNGNNTRSFFDIPLNAEDVVNNETLLSNNDLGFVYLNEDSIQGLFNENSLKPTEEEKPKYDPTLPPDWSLKTKARFLSPSSFAWCARMKGNEEAASIAKATRCQKFESTSPKQADYRIELGRSLVYWQHPTIPWLSLFPRFGAECKLLPHSAAEPITNEDAKSSLYDCWVTSFRSAYQLLRQDLCPFFYVCSQQYTALFQSAAVRPQNKVSCLLTPTSLGFRNSLKSEGIIFTMPLQRKNPLLPPSDENLKSPETNKNDAFVEKLKQDGKLSCPFPASRPGDLSDKENCDKSSVINNRNPDKLEIDEERSSQEDLDPEEEISWKNISDGLTFRKSREINTAMTNDGLPKTAVLIEGLTNTQLLFNYLLNCRSSIANSGSQTGIPPTILSPVAFIGSTLKKLDYRAGIAKSSDDGFRQQQPTGKRPLMRQKFSLDVNGPLMPHHASQIISLLNRTQDGGQFTAALGTHLYTIPFNANGDKVNETDENAEMETADKCGISLECLKQLKSDISPVCLRQIDAAKSLYTWSV